jgi:hypothetical protein
MKTSDSTPAENPIEVTKRRILAAYADFKSPADRTLTLQREIVLALAGRDMAALLREDPASYARVAEMQASLAIEGVRCDVARRLIDELAPSVIEDTGRLSAESSRLVEKMRAAVLKRTGEQLRVCGLFGEDDAVHLVARTKPVREFDAWVAGLSAGFPRHSAVRWVSGGRGEDGKDLPDRCIVEDAGSVVRAHDASIAQLASVRSKAEQLGVKI